MMHSSKLRVRQAEQSSVFILKDNNAQTEDNLLRFLPLNSNNPYHYYVIRIIFMEIKNSGACMVKTGTGAAYKWSAEAVASLP